MQVSSTVLGTYIVIFPDPSIDHAFGDALCCKLRLDSLNVSRASYFSDYDAHKLELVLVHAAADPKEILMTAVSTLLSEVSGILDQIAPSFASHVGISLG